MNIQSTVAQVKQYIPFSNFERNEPSAAKEIYKRLPRTMLVTNNLNFGLHLEAKTTGVRNRYIQINHQNLTKMMVFDVDNPISLYDWKYLDVPIPNLIIVNPRNKHFHMIYLLSDQNFVCRSENARLKDILIYQSIYSELCKRLQADSRYVQKIMKNPFHNHWETEVIHEDTYTFDDFSKYVDLKSLKNFEGHSVRSEESFIRENEGRNCTVFERTRFYAYAILKKYNYGFSTEDTQNFYNAVSDYAENINNEFQAPLAHKEIKATVKSIVNWTLMHFGNASEKQAFEKKDVWGKKSRENSLKTRASTKQRNIQKAGKLKYQGKSIKEICKLLNRSERMVEYYLNEYKKILEQNNLKTEKIKQKVKEIQNSLLEIIGLQFVISDMIGLIDSLIILVLVSLFLDSS